MRHGIALPISINIPFSQLDSADLSEQSGSIGSISLRTIAGTLLAWLALWSSCRPWHLTNPQPSIRCISNAAEVARHLGGAIRLSEGDTIEAAQAVSSPSRNNTQTRRKPNLAGEAA
jgi:hypothetical protein